MFLSCEGKFWRVEMHTRYCKDFLCAVPYIEGFTSMVEKRDTVTFFYYALYLGVIWVLVLLIS